MTNGNKKIQLATNLILKMFFLLFLFFRGKSNNLICHYFSRQVSLIRQYGIFQNLLRNLSATRSQSHVQRTMSRQSTSRYWTKFRSSLQILHCPTHFESWHYRLLGGAIHILCKHFFFINCNIFTNILSIFLLLYMIKISKYSMKNLSKCNVEKKILLFWQKNPVFVKNLEVKLSFVL